MLIDRSEVSLYRYSKNTQGNSRQQQIACRVTFYSIEVLKQRKIGIHDRFLRILYGGQYPSIVSREIERGPCHKRFIFCTGNLTGCDNDSGLILGQSDLICANQRVCFFTDHSAGTLELTDHFLSNCSFSVESIDNFCDKSIDTNTRGKAISAITINIWRSNLTTKL